MSTVLRVTLFSLVVSSLHALPTKGEVASGHAEFQQLEKDSLKVIASDRAIINYQQFNVGEREKVVFVQPSSKSTVLNRITGGEGSQILGQLQSNGQLFLVNPRGIYFGPKAQVNAAAFVASTLNIRNEDFVNDRFHFFQDGSSLGSIVNEGKIAVSPGGFIGLFAPMIQNRGTVIAKAGKVLFGAGEKVTIDFFGDGLIQFSVDGALKEALIENYGTIEAAQGAVELSLAMAKDVVKMVVNTDGFEVAAGIEEENGIIRLVGGKIKADEVHVFGRQIELKQTEIDASGVSGGGTVLIGGDYQGKGEFPCADFVTMDAASVIFADAKEYGDGGKVILWADDTTLFDGKIYARGGANGGNGGFVETSGKGDLGIETGHVDTSAPVGKYGDWLLDPTSITIQNGGGASIAQCSAPNCGNVPSRTISPATIAASASNVALCAQRLSTSSITVTNAVSMNNAGISLTLTAGSGNAGPINLNSSITTRGGAITLTGVVTVGATVTLNTTNATPAGANITFSNTVNGAQGLTLNGGTGGTVTFTGAVGGTTALTSLTATGATINQNSTARTTGALSYTGSSAININGNVTTSGGVIGMTGPVVVTGNRTFDSTNGGGVAAGANINFSSTLNGAVAVTLRAGTGGIVSFGGAVGGVTPLTNLSFTSANTIQVGSNITVTGANPLTFPSPVSLTGPSTITSNNANINFNSTLNGAQALVLAGGTGTTTFTGAIGGTTPLSSLTATAATITQSSTARTTGGLTYNGSTAINLNGNVTTSAGQVTLNGPVTTTATSIDTTNAGGSPVGANVSFTNTLNGAVALVVNGGTGGAVSFTGAVGGTTPLTSLSATGFMVTQSSTARTSGTLTYTGSTGINVAGNIMTMGNIISMVGPTVVSSTLTFDSTDGGGTPAGANISFSNTLNGAAALTLRAGTGGNVIFGGAVGGTTPLTNLSFTSANLIRIPNNVTVSGANPLVFPSPVQIEGVSTITSNNNNITFNSTINGDVALTRTLRLAAGTGSIALNGVVGGVNPLGTLTFMSANNATASTITAGTLTQTAGTGTTTFNGAVATSNILGINLTGTAFTFNNMVTTTGGGGVQIANSGLLSMPMGSNFNLSATFNQSGSGAVQAGNTITTTTGGILFNSAVALTNALSLDSSAGPGQIMFNSTVNSVGGTPFDLTLDAGTSNITISGNMGFINPLDDFLVNQVNNLTILGLTANSATISGGTGITTVNGDLIIGAGGINVTGNNFAVNGNTTTTGGGSVTINNTGTATRGPGTATNISGNYSLIGTGPAFAGGGVFVVDGDVLINPTLTLVGAGMIDTSGGGGNITFNNTINGANDFTLIAGAGSITFGANVGFGIPLGALTISSANDVTAEGIQATSITQTTGTGTTIFNGALTTSGIAGISINTNNITRGAAITTTGGGPLTITNSGTFTSTAAGNINLGGAFTQNGTGAVSISGSISTADANISFASSLSMAGNVSLSSGASGGDITLTGGAQGGVDLSLASGTGSITISSGVGTVTPLTSFLITSAANVSTQAITAATITQSTGTGTTTFNGALNTTAAGGISLTGSSFTFNSPFTTAGTGSVAITNTGLVTFGAAATGSIAGTLTQSGTGSSQLSSSITTGGMIEFQGPFAAVGSGSLAATNQPIAFLSTVNGPGNLTLNPGTNAITMSGAAGGVTPLGNLIITTATNVTTEAITAASITQNAGTGTTLFNGALTATGAISLTGNVFTFIENAAANGGTFTIANAGLLTGSPGKTFTGASGFSQTGAGAVNLGSGVTTTSGSISFVSPMTLIGTVHLNSGVDVILDTVDGNFNLTFTAGQDITAGDIGGTTRVGTVTATTVRNINASDITAAAIVQQAGTGTTSLVGDIDTNTPAGITLVGTNFSRSGAIITTNGGSFSVTNSGSIVGTAINTTSIDGSYTQIGIGPSDSSNLAGTITARLGIFLSSPITLLSDALNTVPIILDTTGGNGNIIVTGTINNDAMAPHTLIIRSGAGNITLSGAVGGVTPIGPFTLGNAHDVTVGALSAASISQEALTSITGIATFNGAIATSGASGIVLSGNHLTFNDTVTTSGTGPVALTNSGLLTIAGDFTVDNTFTQTGAGTVSLGAEINTDNAAISFAGPITLAAPSLLNSGAGVGNITLNGTLNGASTLSVTAGTGNISFQNMIGQTTPVGAITINSATDVLVNAAADLTGAFTVSSATGTTTINGALEAASINLTGATITFNDAVTSTSAGIDIANSGVFTVAALSPISAATTFMQTGTGTVTLGSNISTVGTLSLASDVTMTQNIGLNSGGGALTLSGTVAGVFDLMLTAGAGNISILGTIGSPRIGAFTITNANDITVQAITATSISLLSASGTAMLLGSLDTDGIAGITLIGNNFTTSGTITTANGGPLTITNNGLVTATGASVVTLNGGGAFLQNGAGSVNHGGTITTQNANITFFGPSTVLLDSVFTSNNGNISFQNTIEGDNTHGLTLTAGTGSVTLNGIVGGGTPLGFLNISGAEIAQNQSVQTTGTASLTGTTFINSGANITTTGSDLTLTGNVIISAPSVAFSTGVGLGSIMVTGTLNGDTSGRNLTVSSGTGDITLSGAVGGGTSFNDLTVSGENISLANIGATGVGASGITTLTATTDLNFTGTTYRARTQNYTAGGDFNFTAGALTTMTSSTSAITFNTGTIQLGTTDLTIMSSGGTITLTPLLGTNRNLTVNASTGAMNFVQIGAMGDNLNVVDLTSNAFTPTPINGTNVFANTLNINSATPQVISMDQATGNVTYNSPIIFSGNINYTCGAAGTLTFNDTVDAQTAGVDTVSFDFDPCTGSVVFNGPVGATAPLGSMTINAATNVTASDEVAVGTLAITNGTGLATFNGGITTTAVGGISIQSAMIDLSVSLSTSGGGSITLDNSGALTINNGIAINSSGSFMQIGAGAVTLGANLMTAASTVSFTGPVTLNGATNLNSTGGNISFANTVQGAQNLTLAAGAGSISFNGAVGTMVTPLLAFTVNSANNVTLSAPLFCTSVTQIAGTGTSAFDDVTTSGLNGINLTGTSFTFNGDVTTTNSGPVTVANSSTLTFGNNTYSIAGGLTQNGIGPLSVAGSFTVGGNVLLSQAVTLTNTTSFDTSAANTSITISGPINGGFDLTFNTGSGTLTCASMGNTTPIGALTLTSVGDASLSAISAGSIFQTAGSGTTTIVGNLTTTDVGGITLTGTQFNLNGTVVTGALGPFALSNTGASSLTFGMGTLIDGAFSQSGGGIISLGGTLATDSQDLAFANEISLSAPTTISTGAGGGLLTFSSTINGNQPLTLTGGIGNIVFGANLGATTALGALTVNSVNNITYPLVNAASISQLSATGTTTITGPLNTTGSAGVSIAGGIINQNGAITTAGDGPVTFTNTGVLTVAVGINTVADGGYTQSGGGGVSLGGSVSATEAGISFADPISLTADVSLQAAPVFTNSNSITLNAVTGAQALSLTAVGGSIVLGSDIGTMGTPLTSFTITNADTVSAQVIFATTISQLIGTGATIFNGPLNASGIGAMISLIGTAFTFDDTITTTGPFVLTNSGLATFNAGANATLSQTLMQNGVGSVQLSSTITAQDAVTIFGPLIASGTGVIDTSGGNAIITLFSNVEGPGNLTLSSGAGNITFLSDAGTSVRLGAVNLTTTGALTAQRITASSITQASGNSLYNGALDTNGAGGIGLTGVNINLTSNVTTTGTGGVTLTNSGTLTTTTGSTISSNGVFTQNGSGSVLLACDITGNNDINFSGTSLITLTAPVVINASSGGGDINFSATSSVNGAFAFTLNAGAGDINILSDFGAVTRLGPLTIANCNNLQIQELTASSFTQSAGTGTSSLLGAIDTNGPAGITLVGNNFTTGALAGTVTTTNGGSITITNQGLVSSNAPVVVTIDGSFIQNGPGPIFVGTATARTGFSYTGPCIVAAATTLDSTGANGNITFSNIISGLAGTEALILTAGSGNITLAQPLGTVTTIGGNPVMAIGSLTATGQTISINNIGTMAASGVTGTTTLTANQDVTFTGTRYNANTQNYTTGTHFHINAGALTTFTSSGSVMSFTGGDLLLSTGTNLTMNSGGSNLTLGPVHAQAGNLRSLIFNTGAGDLTIGQIGTPGNGEFASAMFTANNLTLTNAYVNAFTFGYTGTFNAGGTLQSINTALSFPNPVLLQASSTFSTFSTTGADITFSSTLNAASADVFGLILNAGSGNITFTNTVGVPNRLLNLRIDAAGNVTANGAIAVDALVQLSGSGTTTFNGTVTVPGVLGIQLTGQNFVLNNTITTLNNASLTVANSGTLTVNSALSLSGAFSQTISTGPVTFLGSITAGQPILFSGPVSLVGSPSLNTAAANQTITFLNTIGGSGSLTLVAGAGDIEMQQDAGTMATPIGVVTINSCHDLTIQSLFANTVQLNASSGTATFTNNLSTNGASGITLIGTNFTMNGNLTTTNGGAVVITNSGLLTGSAGTVRTVADSYTQNGTGPVEFAGSLTTQNGPISFASDVSCIFPCTFNSSSSSQDITFTNIVDGPSSFAATAGGGTITFGQAVGTSTPFTTFTITTANDVILPGVGTTNSGITDSLSITASNNINLTGTQYTGFAQSYSAGNQTNFSAGTTVSLFSWDDIAFPTGITTLATGSHLNVITNNGGFSFAQIQGTTSEQIIVSAGTGEANLGTVSSTGVITSLVVDSGPITFAGPITANDISFLARGSISNAGGAVLIQTPNTIFFNALEGDVGTLTNAILVQTGGQIFAGAAGPMGYCPVCFADEPASLANFNGSSVDNTVNEIPSNPPCIIIFNGVVIKDCRIPPVPPIPPGPPGPSPIIVVPFRPGFNFIGPIPGVESSWFNLASDYYFLPYFFDKRFVEREVIMMYRIRPEQGELSEWKMIFPYDPAFSYLD